MRGSTAAAVLLAAAGATPGARAGLQTRGGPPPPADAGAGRGQGRFLTNAEDTRSFEWTPTTRTARDAMELTFPKSAGWSDACFSEGGCREGRVMTRAVVASWVEHELLGGDEPFQRQDGRVPVPWPARASEAEEGEEAGDQVGEGQYVGYSRRQVCYIVAKSLLGARTLGYNNGLARILNKTVGWCGSPMPSVRPPANYTPSALTGQFGITLWNLLAACAADPNLEQGRQGPLVLVAKARPRAEVEEVRQVGRSSGLTEARLSACRYDDGDAGPVESAHLEEMPARLCTPPTTGAPGRDFMTGGARRPVGQAVQDISAKFLGGYVFGNACGLGGGQDERLMTYFPEVFALTFFLSQHKAQPQLREPSWILGARMLMVGLDGTGRFDRRLELDAAAPLVSDLIEVDVAGETYRISSSTPFLGFMSENQDFLNESAVWEGRRNFTDMQENMWLARQNRHPLQRAVDAETWFSFMYQVRAWYSAVALTSYHAAVRPVLRAVVKSLGTGPFLSGLWFGDSQLGFLTIWIGHAIAAATWGQGGLPVQYYIYADFTENPGNQCFVHSATSCKECLDRCAADPLPPSSYWLPDWAFMGEGANKSCVVDSDAICGEKSYLDVVAAYKDKSATELWEAVEATLRTGPQTEKQVFDLLLASGR